MTKTVTILSLTTLMLTATAWAETPKAKKEVVIVTVDTFCKEDSYKPKVEKALKRTKGGDAVDLLTRATSSESAKHAEVDKLCAETGKNNDLDGFLKGFGEACLSDCLATLEPYKQNKEYQNKRVTDADCGPKTPTSDWTQCRKRIGDPIPNTLNPRLEEGCAYACGSEEYRMRSVRAQNALDNQACKGNPHTTGKTTAEKKSKGVPGAEQTVRIAQPKADDAGTGEN